MATDYSTMTDAELEASAEALSAEQERRANLAMIPGQIAAMAKTYRDGGGDPADLTDALTPEQVAALTA